MTFSPARALIFGAIGLPVGFILTAFGFAATGRAIDATAIAPWALGIALVSALVGGLSAPKDGDGA